MHAGRGRRRHCGRQGSRRLLRRVLLFGARGGRHLGGDRRGRGRDACGRARFNGRKSLGGGPNWESSSSERAAVNGRAAARVKGSGKARRAARRRHGGGERGGASNGRKGGGERCGGAGNGCGSGRSRGKADAWRSRRREGEGSVVRALGVDVVVVVVAGDGHQRKVQREKKVS